MADLKAVAVTMSPCGHLHGLSDRSPPGSVGVGYSSVGVDRGLDGSRSTTNPFCHSAGPWSDDEALSLGLIQLPH